MTSKQEYVARRIIEIAQNVHTYAPDIPMEKMDEIVKTSYTETSKLYRDVLEKHFLEMKSAEIMLDSVEIALIKLFSRKLTKN